MSPVRRPRASYTRPWFAAEAKSSGSAARFRDQTPIARSIWPREAAVPFTADGAPTGGSTAGTLAGTAAAGAAADRPVSWARYEPITIRMAAARMAAARTGLTGRRACRDAWELVGAMAVIGGSESFSRRGDAGG